MFFSFVKFSTFSNIQGFFIFIMCLCFCFINLYLCMLTCVCVAVLVMLTVTLVYYLICGKWLRMLVEKLTNLSV